jgi:hypothetical protein
MSMIKKIAFAAAATLAVTSGYAQPFENLNFEQANPVIVVGSPYYPYGVTAATALPNWMVSLGGVSQTQITENSPSTGSSWVSLVGPGDLYGSPIDGNYSVLLQGGGPAPSASISQTGLIPAGMQSVFFEAQAGAGTLDVLVGTQDVPFFVIGSGPNYTLYGGNISAWAGYSEPLTFSALQYSGGLNDWEIDDISFSQTAITPEPSPLILTGIGGLIFALHRRLRQR